MFLINDTSDVPMNWYFFEKVDIRCFWRSVEKKKRRITSDINVVTGNVALRICNWLLLGSLFLLCFSYVFVMFLFLVWRERRGGHDATLFQHSTVNVESNESDTWTRRHQSSQTIHQSRHRQSISFNFTANNNCNRRVRWDAVSKVSNKSNSARDGEIGEKWLFLFFFFFFFFLEKRHFQSLAIRWIITQSVINRNRKLRV